VTDLPLCEPRQTERSLGRPKSAIRISVKPHDRPCETDEASALTVAFNSVLDAVGATPKLSKLTPGAKTSTHLPELTSPNDTKLKVTHLNDATRSARLSPTVFETHALGYSTIPNFADGTRHAPSPIRDELALVTGLRRETHFRNGEMRAIIDAVAIAVMDQHKPVVAKMSANPSSPLPQVARPAGPHVPSERGTDTQSITQHGTSRFTALPSDNICNGAPKPSCAAAPNEQTVDSRIETSSPSVPAALATWNTPTGPFKSESVTDSQSANQAAATVETVRSVTLPARIEQLEVGLVEQPGSVTSALLSLSDGAIDVALRIELEGARTSEGIVPSEILDALRELGHAIANVSVVAISRAEGELASSDLGPRDREHDQHHSSEGFETGHEPNKAVSLAQGGVIETAPVPALNVTRVM
jgi:hypothetical protein